jgi:hypothetical protein
MASHLENERKHGQFASILIIQEKYEKVLSEDLSEKELKARMERLNQMRVDPGELPENAELIEKLEAIHAEVSPEQKSFVIGLINAFNAALASGSPVSIAKTRKIIELNLPKLENWDPLAEFILTPPKDEEDWDDPWAEEDDGFNLEDFLKEEEHPPVRLGKLLRPGKKSKKPLS